MGLLYNTHGHKLRFPSSKKAQFVTAQGICGVEQFAKLSYGSMLESDKHNS